MTAIARRPRASSRPSRTTSASTTASTSTTPAASPSSPPCAGSAGHDIVEHALTALRNLDHRGATGADPLVGDGAGILTQVPDAFLREVVDFTLPSAGAYAVGSPSCRMDEAERAATVEADRADRRRGGPHGPRLARRAGRRRPRRRGRARLHAAFAPAVRLARAMGRQVGIGLDRLAFCLRKRAERETDVYFASLSLAHPGLQGHADDRPARAVLPRPVRTARSRPSSPWSTRGSRPTPSRPGRSRTPSGSSRTTARSTPSRATATG